MSLTSWSEPALCRNIRQLDPFQRQRTMTLASAARAVRFHVALGAAIVRAANGFPSDSMCEVA